MAFCYDLGTSHSHFGFDYLSTMVSHDSRSTERVSLRTDFVLRLVQTPAKVAYRRRNLVKGFISTCKQLADDCVEESCDVKSGGEEGER
jgi:hypothetical protein